jgi:glycosyltransferase involved in cell wall biosynthesis
MAACMDASAGPLVLMLVRTNYATDARVTKEAVSLVRGGYRVKVLAAWEAGLPRREVTEGVRVLRPAHRLAYAAGHALGLGGGVPSGSGARSSPLRQWFYAAAAALDATLFALRTLVEALRERPAVIHAHDLNVLPGAWLASRVTGARLVYDSHEVAQFSVQMQKRPRLWRAAARAIERRCMRGAALVITVNPSCARAIARIHGVARPLVLYNAPRLADRDAPTAMRLREFVGARDDEAVAVYCGGLQPQRGIEEAIAALAQVPQARLALLGYGAPAYLESLKAAATKCGVGERLFLVPAVPSREVSAAIRGADLSLVLIQDAGLSYYLSSPNKLFESVHAGLPIIGADFPEIRAVLERYGCGLPVDQRSPQAIAEAMRSLLDDAPLRRRLAAGCDAAARELNWENQERVLLSSYAGSR